MVSNLSTAALQEFYRVVHLPLHTTDETLDDVFTVDIGVKINGIIGHAGTRALLAALHVATTSLLDQCLLNVRPCGQLALSVAGFVSLVALFDFFRLTSFLAQQKLEKQVQL